jgi:hypothetical protein
MRRLLAVPPFNIKVLVDRMHNGADLSENLVNWMAEQGLLTIQGGPIGPNSLINRSILNFTVNWVAAWDDAELPSRISETYTATGTTLFKALESVLEMAGVL